MASKFCFALVFLVFVYGSQAKAITEDPKALKDDLIAAAKPISDAFASVERQVHSLIERIEDHPAFKSTSKTISNQIEEVKGSFKAAYDKLTACKQVFQEGVEKTPSIPPTPAGKVATEKPGFHIFN